MTTIIFVLFIIWAVSFVLSIHVMITKGIEPSFWPALFVMLPIANTYIVIRYFRIGGKNFNSFWEELNNN